jgi:hypothetical protein
MQFSLVFKFISFFHFDMRAKMPARAAGKPPGLPVGFLN